MGDDALKKLLLETIKKYRLSLCACGGFLSLKYQRFSDFSSGCKFVKDTHCVKRLEGHFLIVTIDTLNTAVNNEQIMKYTLRKDQKTFR